MNDDITLKIGVFLVVLAFFLGLLRNILSIIVQMRSKTPLHLEYVERRRYERETEECRAQLSRRMEELEQELQRRAVDGQSGRLAIHRDVRKMEERVSALEAYSETMNQRQIQQSGLLNQILSELGEVRGELKAKV